MEKKELRSFDLLVHSAWGALFRGNAERFRRHPSASTGFTVEYGLTVHFRLRTLFPISRAAKRKA